MKQLVLFPKKTIDKIIENQNRILEMLNSMQIQNPQAIQKETKYIPESEAKQMLGKGSTWFWQKRTNGELAYSKVGNRIFYMRCDIDKLFEENRQETF